MVSIKFDVLETVIGSIYVCSSDRGVCGVLLGEKEFYTFRRTVSGFFFSRGRNKLLDSLIYDLRRYFKGVKVSFNQKLDFLIGTEFERAVWMAARSIPWGRARSYKWIAESIGRPRSYRAVGNALSKNPMLIVVPCHRVIRGNGGLGGFSSGLKVKRKLLALEGIKGV